MGCGDQPNTPGGLRALGRENTTPHKPNKRSGYFYSDLLRFDTDTNTWETLFERLPFSAVGFETRPVCALVEGGWR